MQNHINNNTLSYFKESLSNLSHTCRMVGGTILVLLSLNTTELNAQDIEMQNSANKKVNTEKTIEKDQEEKREKNAISSTVSLMEGISSLPEEKVNNLLKNIEENGFSQIIISFGNQVRKIPANINTDGKKRLQVLQKLYGPFKIETSTAYGESIEVYITADRKQVYENIDKEIQTMNDNLNAIDNELQEVENKVIESKKKEGIHYAQQLIRSDNLTLTESAAKKIVSALYQVGFGEIKIYIDSDSSISITTNNADKHTIKAIQSISEKFNSKELKADSLTIQAVEEKSGKIEIFTTEKPKKIENSSSQVTITEKKDSETESINKNNDSLNTTTEAINYDLTTYYYKFKEAADFDKANDYGNRNTPKCQAIIDSIDEAFANGKLTVEFFSKKQAEYDDCMRK